MSAKFAKSKLIAITGNICSGKTEFLSALKKQGHETISTDEIVDKLWQDKNNLAKIAEIFSLTFSPELKETVKKLVFSQPKKLKELEEVFFPQVFAKLKEVLEKSKNSYIFVEVPLLFERNLRDKFDFTVLVYADLETLKTDF